ncbi:hypothetical protein [Frankia sp. AgKG'84/4]|uniref:hypothetical protein n=1 Tax=Frankia sp. AgKG'84/4 TaxID=573490 RepID=UPI00200EEDE4|nr:hypothetical protein [Frankia sp. AgKG'84/4]MCL9797786.1 hypothetical protein [Frankia sp. AgKG'84/4]
MATREQGLRRVRPVTAGLAAVATAGMIGFGMLAQEHSAAAATATTGTAGATGRTRAGTTWGPSGGSTVWSGSGSTHAATGGS